MKRVSGQFVTSSVASTSVNAFVPYKLPPDNPPLDTAKFSDLNRAAELSLARLSGVAGLVPSVNWLLYSAIRKEALLTSQIEGTQASLTDLFDNDAGIRVQNTADVEEVSNYLAAFHLVQDHLRSSNGLPISNRLICDAHRLLMNGVRGGSKQPGEIRQSQNWIGGTRPETAIFVPPPPNLLQNLLSDLERFIHQESSSLPPLVKIALIHAQFETIHPFLDGNGRMGRLLIAALLEDWKLLPEPLIYLSGYLKANQMEYYRHLSLIRTEGNWESWIEFFLKGVIESSIESEKTIGALAKIVSEDKRKLLEVNSVNNLSFRLFEMLPMMPRFTIEHVREKLSTTFPTANAAVKTLEEMNIVVETTHQKKNRCFSYQRYIQVLN